MLSPASSVDLDSSQSNASQFKMPLANRSKVRNVHIYDLNNPDTVLGGLYLAQEITNSNIYAMLGNFIVPIEDPSSQNGFDYFLQTKDGVKRQQLFSARNVLS